MGCACGGSYNFVKEFNSLVCISCGRHSPYQCMPSYEEVVVQNNNYRKAIEDIVECRGDLNHLIEEARKLL